RKSATTVGKPQGRALFTATFSRTSGRRFASQSPALETSGSSDGCQRPRHWTPPGDGRAVGGKAPPIPPQATAGAFHNLLELSHLLADVRPPGAETIDSAGVRPANRLFPARSEEQPVGAVRRTLAAQAPVDFRPR